MKSFYASVECVERGLNPLDTNLVVADKSRTDKTICLAVSPSLKSYGISGRPRLFEVVQRVRDVNQQRCKQHNAEDLGRSYINSELQKHPAWELDYIVAKPQMSRYMEVSTQVYEVYLSFFAADDIHVYSVDEVFIDATQYLALYKMSATELAASVIRQVLNKTGITATVGIGSNLYLSKVAMDIVAKHIPADEHGVRIAELDEHSYRKLLWNHTPLTSFWRVGRGTARTLERYGLDTMGKIARCSLNNEDLLYKLFGVHAELLIDHAWGWEPCSIADIKGYRPSSHSLSNGQVLCEPYTKQKAGVVLKEMAETMALQLMRKRLITDQIIVDVNFDRATISLHDADSFAGAVVRDRYGRIVPKNVHGSVNLKEHTSSASVIMQATIGVFDKIVQSNMLIRRLNITANNILSVDSKPQKKNEQLDLFAEELKPDISQDASLKRKIEKEQRVQQTMLDIKNNFGKNAILRGLNFRDGATARERNKQIGGHKA